MTPVVVGEDPTAAVASEIEKSLNDELIAGAQVILGDRDSIHFMNSYGVCDLETRRPVDDDTLFCVGSCSKMFVAAIILGLVSEERLDLDVPVDRWLAGFSSLKQLNGESVRAPSPRELLCHASGIYSQKDGMTTNQRKWIRDFRLTLKESVEGISTEALIHDPGQSFAYSGAGYCVLGSVAEVCSGLEFEELLSKRICKPLGLKSATFFPDLNSKRVAAGYVRIAGELERADALPHEFGDSLRLTLPGGGIYCSAKDLSRFLQMLLAEGRYKDARLIDADHWREMTKVQIESARDGYGFGLFVKGDENNQQSIALYHGGALNGSYCYFILDLRTGRFGVISHTGDAPQSGMRERLKNWVEAPLPVMVNASETPVVNLSGKTAARVGPAKGSLVVMGGGGRSFYPIFQRFLDLAGGRHAEIVIVPTAASSDPNYDYTNHRTLVSARERFGLTKAKVVHTHDREEADTESFAEQIRKAQGVWFTGGRQWRIADAYRGTLSEAAFHAVLDKGGVIGGSSAGATIQGSFLARGDTRGNQVMIGDHQHGFGFLRNTAIDQHLIARGRQFDLIEVLSDPRGQMEANFDRTAMLGIGIDEDTAIVVQKDVFEVIGKPNGRVLIYDPKSWTSDTPQNKKYQTLFVGDRYNLARREEIIVKSEDRPRKPPVTTEGFYKEIFMDGGVSLTSRKRLPAAETLGCTYEYYAGKNLVRQRELFVGSAKDTNGILLYPDGQPRFRMIYVNGGAATLHGKSLGDRGRATFRKFNLQGGSYCGSCAGAFLSGLNADQKPSPRDGYLHLFPYNTLNSGMKRERVGHFIPHDSPLLDYRDFGGDRYVADIYHNNGNWLSSTEGEHLNSTEILATYDAPTHRANGGAAIWAYRATPDSGRIVSIGSHPEAVTWGERLDLTEACFQYALDGVASPKVKATLKNGVARVMDRKTEDNDPEHTRIGDRQFHHFQFEVSEAMPSITLELSHPSGAQLNVYLNRDAPAFRSNANYWNTDVSSEKRIVRNLKSGLWHVSVECASTVKAVRDDAGESFIYNGNTDVLNGIPYTIKMTAR